MTTSFRSTARPARRKLAGASALGAVAMLALAGCASTASADDDQASAAVQADTVSIADAWVKAADEGMSAGFGVISNDGDDDVTIVSVSGDASTMFELHETVDSDEGGMMMQEIDGGFVIAAGDDLLLEPGGSHIMFMDLTDPLEAGDEVTLTLTFADDSTLDLTAPVKDYEGANESYEGDDMDGDEHEGHDH